VKKEDSNGIWVFAELCGGSVRKVSFELLGAARRLADAQSEKLAAVILAGDGGASEIPEEAIAFGADEVYVVEGPGYETYNTEAYCCAIATLAEKYRPSAIIIGATDLGRDLAPRLAARLRTGLTADCIDMAYNSETANIDWICPAFGGKLIVTISCPDSRPQMGTVRQGMYDLPRRSDARRGRIIAEPIPASPESSLVRVLDTVVSAAEGPDLESAQVIVAGGHGMGSAENFEKLYRLAELLGGKVAASRAPVEFGWIDEGCMIGHSGKSVSTKLYIALGISGTIQHVAGVKSDLIIAVNKDRNAPIFDIADISVVGDANEFVSALVARLEK
jgi:electron transfer flavoprotein alpha subunit